MANNTATMSTTAQTPAAAAIVKRTTPFNPAHEVKYGLEIKSRDPMSGAVTLVACNFCTVFGREEKVGQIRKPSTTIKKFKVPFRAEGFRQHLDGQHHVKWAEYQELAPSKKADFFSDAVTVRRIGEGALLSGNRLTFTIKASIIHAFFDELFKNQEGTGAPMTNNVPAIFKPAINYEQRTLFVYKARVENIKFFYMAVGFVALGLSVRSAARSIACVSTTLDASNMTSCNEDQVSAFVHVAMTSSLHRLGEALSRVWAFSLSFDSITVNTTPCINVSVRFMTGKTLHHFHLFALHLQSSHTDELVITVFQKAMKAICPTWRERLLSVCSDGARNMAGRVREITTHIEERAAKIPEAKLTRFWCGTHALNLVVEKAVYSFCGGSFYSTLTACTGYLRRQQHLANEMNTQCPEVLRKQWPSFGNVLDWFRIHRVKLLAHFHEQRPACTPSKRWWMGLLAMIPIFKEINILFKQLQPSDLTLSLQQQQFSMLLETMRAVFSVQGPLPENQSAALQANSYFVKGPFALEKTDVTRYICGLGSFVAMTFQDQEEEEKGNLKSGVANLFLTLAEGIHSTQPRHNQDGVSMQRLPPILPTQYAQMLMSEFSDLIRKFHSSTPDLLFIEELENEHLRMYNDYLERDEFRQVIDGIADSVSFEDGWSLVQAEFPRICRFAGGMATAYPAQTQMESQLSVSDWKEDAPSSSLIDFSIECAMHCEQFKKINELKDDI